MSPRPAPSRFPLSPAPSRSPLTAAASLAKARAAPWQPLSRRKASTSGNRSLGTGRRSAMMPTPTRAARARANACVPACVRVCVRTYVRACARACLWGPAGSACRAPVRGSVVVRTGLGRNAPVGRGWGEASSVLVPALRQLRAVPNGCLCCKGRRGARNPLGVPARLWKREDLGLSPLKPHQLTPSCNPF